MIVVTPLTFADGDNLELSVKLLPEGLVLVSDNGMVADRLAHAGIDLAHPDAATRWAALTRGLPPALGEAAEWEVATIVDADEMVRAMWDVASVALRADTLAIRYDPQGAPRWLRLAGGTIRASSAASRMPAASK